LRRDVQIALLRNDKTPLSRALALAQRLPTPVLRDVLSHSRLDASIKTYLLDELEKRTASKK
jgi:serine kinase of HPr protein (carbohydrate metabolism regulator)